MQRSSNSYVEPAFERARQSGYEAMKLVKDFSNTAVKAASHAVLERLERQF